jgi:hypothetical protein
MNRREFLKLIPAVIGGAIAAKVLNSRERAIDCGSDKTIEGLPEKEYTGYIGEMRLTNEDPTGKRWLEITRWIHVVTEENGSIYIDGKLIGINRNKACWHGWIRGYVSRV